MVAGVAAGLLFVAACSSSRAHTAAPAQTIQTGMLLSCSDGGATFPPSALRSSPTADQGNSEIAVALRQVLATSPAVATAGSTPHGWRQLYDTGTRAGFLSTPTDAMPGGLLIELSKDRGTWRFFSSGTCTRDVARPGLVNASWAVDPAHGIPKPTDTQVHIAVQDLECNDGRALTLDRIHPPVIGWTNRAVTVAIYLTPVKGMHTCPGPAAPAGQPSIDGLAAVAYTVDLGQPLGRRQLLDGTRYPPRPAALATR